MRLPDHLRSAALDVAAAEAAGRHDLSLAVLLGVPQSEQPLVVRAAAARLGQEAPPPGIPTAQTLYVAAADAAAQAADDAITAQAKKNHLDRLLLEYKALIAKRASIDDVTHAFELYRGQLKDVVYFQGQVEKNAKEAGEAQFLLEKLYPGWTPFYYVPAAVRRERKWAAKWAGGEAELFRQQQMKQIGPNLVLWLAPFLMEIMVWPAAGGGPARSVADMIRAETRAASASPRVLALLAQSAARAGKAAPPAARAEQVLPAAARVFPAVKPAPQAALPAPSALVPPEPPPWAVVPSAAGRPTPARPAPLPAPFAYPTAGAPGAGGLVRPPATATTAPVAAPFVSKKVSPAGAEHSAYIEKLRWLLSPEAAVLPAEAEPLEPWVWQKLHELLQKPQRPGTAPKPPAVFEGPPRLPVGSQSALWRRLMPFGLPAAAYAA